MKSKRKSFVALLSFSVLGFCNWQAVEAQNRNQMTSPPQSIKGDNGGLFMEEEQIQSPRGRNSSNPRVNVINESPISRQQVNDSTGNDFMEEVTQPAPRKNAKVPIGWRNTDVQVDPKGQIVPMLNRNAGPIQYQYNSGLQAYQEMPVPTIAPTYANPLAMPYNMYGRPAAVGTTFVPVAPGMIPGIRSMNFPPGYYYGNNFGYMPYRQTQYSGTYSQTSLTGDSTGMIMPMFKDFDR